MDQGQNKEYQKIIDDYARLTSTEINQNSSKIGTKPKPEPIPSNLIEDLSSPPPVNLSSPPLPPPSIPSPPPLPPAALSPGHGFNPFKYLFIFSLIVFLGVFGTLAYSFYQKYLVINSTGTTAPTSVPAPSVTPLPTATCQLNDQSYKVGQSFDAADGCNTCTCGSDLTISCTELDCSSVTPSAATQSSIPADWKTYDNKSMGLSFSYPSTWKLTACDPTDSLPVLNIQKNGSVVTCGHGGQSDISIKFYPGNFNIDTSYLYSNRYVFNRSVTTVDSLESEKITLEKLLDGQEEEPESLPMISISIPHQPNIETSEWGYLVVSYLSDTINEDNANQILSTFKFF